MNCDTLSTTCMPRMLSVLRVVSAYLFLLHGTSKILHIPHVAYFDNLQLMSMLGAAGILELVGGSLLILGLFTRPVAFLLSGQMAVAYFMVHANMANFWLPTMNKGEAAVLYCFIFLFFSVSGGGAWSLDAMRKKSAA